LLGFLSQAGGAKFRPARVVAWAGKFIGCVIPPPFHYFSFLVLRHGEAAAQHQKRKFGGGFAAPEPPSYESILADLV